MFISSLIVSDYPSGHLRLTTPDLKYAAQSLEWVSNKEISQYMGADFSDVSLETERKRIEGQLADKDTRSWMIELDGQVIGNIEINSIQVASQEYGISAGKLSVIIGNKRYWGKRIAPFVEKKVMDWMFTEGGFELLVARVLPVNERSWHALERLRFDFQGIKADEQHPDEQWRMYTMTKDRWLEVREAVATSLHVA